MVIAWLAEEFGLNSIRETGRNAYLIVLSRACRMFAYGATSLVLALFFAELNFSDSRIGLFMTLTLLGDVLLGLLLTLVADKVGRRKVLFGGSLLMVFSGLSFAVFEGFWVLLLAAVVGVISPGGGDWGPFRSVEESVLSQLTSPKTRSDVLAWYVTFSTVGSAVGSEASGRAVHALSRKEGWGLVDAYHTLFWAYAAMGLVNALLVLQLTDACEMTNAPGYAQVGQDERLSIDSQDNDMSNSTTGPPAATQSQKPKRYWTLFVSQLSKISRPTRMVMRKLWLLMALDSLADGMTPFSLTNYYIDINFHPTKSFLGDISSAAYVLGAISSVFAGPLAKRIGLVNTMVFTHVPSSAAVLFFGLPNSLVLAVILLFVRAGLNNMDQAPRSALIAAVVKSEERTAVMGITNLLRTLAATTGPSITGLLAGSDRFWLAFFIAGLFRLAYDFGLYFMFTNIRLYQHEAAASVHEVDRHENLEDERNMELERLATPDSLASHESR